MKSETIPNEKRKESPNIFYRLLMRFVAFVMRIAFGCRLEVLKDVPQPYLLLSNHNTDFDCVFIGVAARDPLAFVATETIMRMPFWGFIAQKFFHPIVHNKGTMGVATSKNIIRTLRGGMSVAMFPEGNRSFSGVTCPIPPATAKLARASRSALITYRLEGGYLSYPRWASGPRRGRISGSIVNIYTPEMLAAMTDAQVQAAIEGDLYVDAYGDQRKKPVAFRGQKRAECLESTIFMCPECGKIGTLKSRGNMVFCQCGLESEYDKFGMLNAVRRSGADQKSSERLSYTVHQLDRLQRKGLEDLCKTAGGCSLFEDSVTESFVDENHQAVESRNIVLKGYTDRFTAGDDSVPFEKITGISINRRNLLLVHVADMPGHLEFKGPGVFNALKYLYLYRSVCGSRNGLL